VTGEASPPAYTLLSRWAALELVATGEYSLIACRGHSRSYAKYYCKKLDGELECVRIWWESWIAEGGASLFRGTPEEVYLWILRCDAGLIDVDRARRALEKLAGRKIAREKLGEARKSMLRKVLGEEYELYYSED